MLQQTQVATVIPYYQRFLCQFPTVQTLAESDEQALLGHWEGLGYYRRARSMHAAAREIVDHHGGQFPESIDEVLKLPGVGRYTAGAILSISRQQRLPIVEGNTQRVYSRWIAMRGVATSPAATKLLWEFAERMLPRKNSGDFNQAAMELGALVCTPKDPDCGQCPVASQCCAKLQDLQEQIPGKVSRLAYEDRTEFALVVAEMDSALKRTATSEPRYLLRPLPEGRRWAGLWDFPRTTEESLSSVDQAAKRLSEEVGVRMRPSTRLATIRHAVTRYRIQLHVHFATIETAELPPAKPWRYVSVGEMVGLPMSVTGRKIAKLLTANRQARLPI